MEESKGPKWKLNVGEVSVAVWENVIKKDGREFPVQNVTIQRRYKDGEEWKSSQSFRPADLPKAILALEKAWESLVLKEVEG